MNKSGLIFAQVLLDYRQHNSAYWSLILLDGNLTKLVLLITVRLNNGNAQPGKQPEIMRFRYNSKKLEITANI